MAMALLHNFSSVLIVKMLRTEISEKTHLPLGSVWLDHLGVHLMTVEAQEGGKCSSNIKRYQYLHPPLALLTHWGNW